MRPRLLGNIAPPDTISLLNAALGLGAIISISMTNTKLGASLILLCAITDGLDGLVAKHTSTSDIGVDIDSLGDVISFGVAPFYLIYMASTNLQPIAAFLPFIYTLAAIIRLATYNIHDADNPGFTGAPSTLAGAMIAALYLTDITRYIDIQQGIVFIALSLILAYLMLTDIHYPDLKDSHALAMGAIMAGAAVSPHFTDQYLPIAILIMLIVYLVFSPWFYPEND